MPAHLYGETCALNKQISLQPLAYDGSRIELTWVRVCRRYQWSGLFSLFLLLLGER